MSAEGHLARSFAPSFRTPEPAGGIPDQTRQRSSMRETVGATVSWKKQVGRETLRTAPPVRVRCDVTNPAHQRPIIQLSAGIWQASISALMRREVRGGDPEFAAPGARTSCLVAPQACFRGCRCVSFPFQLAPLLVAFLGDVFGSECRPIRLLTVTAGW